MKTVTILGTRPQFIKAWSVSRAIESHNLKAKKEDRIIDYVVHTGQHYDDCLSGIHFEDLRLPKPNINMQVGSGSHGWQTGIMLIRIEATLLRIKPDFVIVYGDTNSTLAGAIAAVKLKIPVVHIESGLRSSNKDMPEEHNRILTDHCSEVLFCPTRMAKMNLENEGICGKIIVSGDTMLDSTIFFSKTLKRRFSVCDELNLRPKGFVLATIHRPVNTDNAENLNEIVAAFGKIEDKIIFPVHPRTLAALREFGIHLPKNVHRTEPVGYLDMLDLEKNARIILTDSGGVQKEAFFLKTPCVTIREETEWMETVFAGGNCLVECNRDKIAQMAEIFFYFAQYTKEWDGSFGDGHAGEQIVSDLLCVHEG